MSHFSSPLSGFKFVMPRCMALYVPFYVHFLWSCSIILLMVSLSYCLLGRPVVQHNLLCDLHIQWFLRALPSGLSQSCRLCFGSFHEPPSIHGHVLQHEMVCLLLLPSRSYYVLYRYASTSIYKHCDVHANQLCFLAGLR